MEDTEYFSCSGGGTKGLMFAGLLDAFEDYFCRLGIPYEDWRRRLKGLSGTSAGTICCLTIILGLDKIKRKKIIFDIFSDLRNIIPCPDIALLVSSYGLESGNSFKNYIKQILTDSGLNEDTTLGDIKRLFGKEFVCVASDLTTQKPIYFSGSDTPEIKIYDAIYMSCSIPFMFAPVKYKDKHIVDGSLTEDVPFFFKNKKTMYVTIPKLGYGNEISSWPDYIQCLLSFPIAFQENDSKLKNECHISIEGKKYKKKFPDFDLHLNDMMTTELISYGYMIVMDTIFDNNISKYMGTLVIIFIKILETEFMDYEHL
tara:strand:+ start:3468 stop:4409 length:942 start_codon:yes stop_codon:yes gene_type:complete